MQVFHENALLRQHVLIHFKCSKCEIQFVSRADLKAHVESVHWRMRNVCDRLDLSQSVLDASTQLYKDFHGRMAKGRFRRPPPDDVVAACLFGATRLMELNFPAKTFCSVFKTKVAILFKTMRLIQSELDVSFAPVIKIEGTDN